MISDIISSSTSFITTVLTITTFTTSRMWVMGFSCNVPLNVTCLVILWVAYRSFPN